MNSDKNIEHLKPGDSHYKAYVGPPEKYDLIGAMQFRLLTNFGLRDYHKVLDVGCGSLRLGKLLIPYLRKANYFGIEPNKWLIDDGINNELGKDILKVKKPVFSHISDFELNTFNEKFDFLIAQSIFSHASSKQITDCMKQAKIVMNPNAIFLATFILGETNYTGEEWVYPGCVTYKHKFIVNIVNSNGLNAIKLNTAHPNGQTWYVIFNDDMKPKINKIISGFNDKKKQNNIVDKLKKNPLIKKIYFLIKKNKK